MRQTVTTRPVVLLSAVLLVAGDALRLIFLRPTYQSGVTDAFEAIVVFLAAAACIRAARQSSGISRALWTTIALYFALNLAADVHDFVADTPLGISHAIPTLEFLGWCTYLPLALIIFFPISEEARLKWRWIPVIDFLQIAIAATVACFELVYLYHRNLNEPWTQFGRPEAVRNTLICTGLLLRALVDPSRQARKIYSILGLAFTGITLVKLISPVYEAVAPALIRPAAFMVIGIFAA